VYDNNYETIALTIAGCNYSRRSGENPHSGNLSLTESERFFKVNQLNMIGTLF
jgi:hypothetical protein